MLCVVRHWQLLGNHTKECLLDESYIYSCFVKVLFLRLDNKNPKTMILPTNSKCFESLLLGKMDSFLIDLQ